MQAYPRGLGSTAAEPAQPVAATASSETQQADRAPAADIHLDGTVLGRWVTRYLEREVNRPPAGATGFDPRMTPSWSGAPIGN
jgi:hypothetical protein